MKEEGRRWGRRERELEERVRREIERYEEKAQEVGSKEEVIKELRKNIQDQRVFENDLTCKLEMSHMDQKHLQGEIS